MHPTRFEQQRGAARLRRVAETQLAATPPAEAPGRSAEELLHELRVHQIELEMQNEELRRAQTALEESRDRYLDLYEFAPLGYLTLARDGTIAEINLTAASLLGAERRKLLHSRFEALIATHDRDQWYHQFVNMVKNSVGRQKIELRLQHGDGSFFYGRLDCLRLETDSAALTVRIALTDIDELKRTEMLLRASNERIRLLNEHLEQRVQEELGRNREKELLLIQQSRLAAIGEVIHNVSHHWRQPLNAVSLILANLKDAYEFHELDQDYLDKEVAGGQRLIQEMSTTIDRFRGFFLPDMEKQNFRVCTEVDEAVKLLAPAFRSANIEIEFAPCPGEHDIMGYPGDFARVVLSVLTNARDAIAKKDAAGKIHIKVAEDGEMVRVSISDNGGGVPAAVLDKVFDPYFTTQASGNGSGTGLGLYLARIAMDEMGGSIALCNREAGLEVLLSLPIT